MITSVKCVLTSLSLTIMHRIILAPTGRIALEKYLQRNALNIQHRSPRATGTAALICLLQSVRGEKCILSKLFDKDCLKVCLIKYLREDILREQEPRSRAFSTNHYWYSQDWIALTSDTEERAWDEAELGLSTHWLRCIFLMRMNWRLMGDPIEYPFKLICILVFRINWI